MFVPDSHLFWSSIIIYEALVSCRVGCVRIPFNPCIFQFIPGIRDLTKLCVCPGMIASVV